MTDLADSYMNSADILLKRIDELKADILLQQNIEIINGLKARKNLLEEERYDIMSIAYALRSGVRWRDYI